MYGSRATGRSLSLSLSIAEECTGVEGTEIAVDWCSLSAMVWGEELEADTQLTCSTSSRGRCRATDGRYEWSASGCVQVLVQRLLEMMSSASDCVVNTWCHCGPLCSFAALDM